MKRVLPFIALILAISCAKNGNQKPLDLNVMTFNIRLDTESDSLNAWQYRKDVAAQIVKNQQSDIVGMQEVLHNQLTDMLDRLPEYSYIGVGRADGKETGEYSPILYKKDRFTKIENGNFWLSENPDSIGVKGWDAACERVATWAILKDSLSGKQFFVINTHFDHMGEHARRESVTLLLNRIYDYKKYLPVIALGDFNATPDSEIIQGMVNPANAKSLLHTRDIAMEKDSVKGTFHNFGKIPLAEREFIDFIFVTKGIKVNKHEILSDKLNEIFVSDHNPVVAKIEIE